MNTFIHGYNGTVNQVNEFMTLERSMNSELNNIRNTMSHIPMQNFLNKLEEKKSPIHKLLDQVILSRTQDVIREPLLNLGYTDNDVVSFFARLIINNKGRSLSIKILLN